MAIQSDIHTEEEFYSGDEICIVGIGSVLPDADNVSEFWNNLTSGHISIKDLPPDEFDESLYFDPTKKIDNKTYSYKGAVVHTKNSYTNKLHYMAEVATGEALACLSSSKLEEKKIDVYLGCMSNDGFLNDEKFYVLNAGVIEEYISENTLLHDKKKVLNNIKKKFHYERYTKNQLQDKTLASSALSVIKKKYNLHGKSALIDAACASSLAAFDVSCNVLLHDEADMVVVGGFDSAMYPEAFVLFSRAGALSQEVCIPFDKASNGISLGEGAVVFVLQKLKYARRDNNTIYGIVRSIGSSSDGNASSFFSPSTSGQLLALERAYEKAYKENVVYIECHGTGTRVGDMTEAGSLSDFFVDAASKIPIGSVKSQIGHTRGAAGSAGVLKALMVINKKVIPASSYIQKSSIDSSKNVFVNQEKIIIEQKNISVGVSAFGFGNINYHVVLEEYSQQKHLALEHKKLEAFVKNIVLVGQGSASLEEINYSEVSKEFKIIPSRIDQIDTTQILALLACKDAINGNPSFFKDSNSVRVIAATSEGLLRMDAFSYRVKCNVFSSVDGLSVTDVAMLTNAICKKNGIEVIREDMTHGVLNNVISDKISNFYNLRGKNFNVDANFNSRAVAIDIAIRELTNEEGVVVVVYQDESLSEDGFSILRGDVHCLLFSTLEYAKNNSLPILSENVHLVYTP